MNTEHRMQNFWLQMTDGEHTHRETLMIISNIKSKTTAKLVFSLIFQIVEVLWNSIYVQAFYSHINILPGAIISTHRIKKNVVK